MLAALLQAGALTTALLTPTPDPTSSTTVGNAAGSNEQTLTLGVYTSDKPTEMFKKFNPITDFLSAEASRTLGHSVTIELQIFSTYEEANDALVRGTVDFTRFGPASYIIAKQRNKGVKLLAMEHKAGQKRFQGVLVAAADSDIQSIDDIKGRSFAFGDENSTIGRYLAQALLVDNDIHARDLSEYDYLGRHDAVARAVEVGDFDVGSLKESTFNKMNEDGTLRVIERFDNVTKPWVARPGLSGETFRALRDALLAANDEDMLKELKVSGFLEAKDEDYKFVRQGMARAKAFGK